MDSLLQHVQNTINSRFQSFSRLKPDIHQLFEKFKKKSGLNKILNTVLRQHRQQMAIKKLLCKCKIKKN